MYDFSKATDTERYFADIINELSGNKITGVYSAAPFWFSCGHFIYEQDEPVYIIFDNAKCLIIEYFDINRLNVEYRKMTEEERRIYDKSSTKDLFNHTSNVHDGRTLKLARIAKSVLPYESLEKVELKRVTGEYSAWIGGGIVEDIKPTEETFNEIKFVMKSGKSFIICPDDPEIDGYSLLWSEDAESAEYPV